MTKPKLVDMPYWPRLLSVEEAAAYVGVSVNTFVQNVGETWPKPIRFGRRKLFDRASIDRAVDVLSKSSPNSPAEAIRRERRRAGGQIEAR